MTHDEVFEPLQQLINQRIYERTHAMTANDISYVNAQLLRAVPLPLANNANGQIKIKIHSERGESNWLNITPEQLKKIELVLLGA